MRRRLLAACVLGGLAATQAAVAASPEEKTVSLEVHGATHSDLSRSLSQLAGVPIVFVASDPEQFFSLELKGYPLSQLLADLAKQGAVAVGGRQNKPEAATPVEDEVLGRNFSITARDVDAAALSRLLTEVLQTQAEFRAQDPQLKIDLDLKNVSVGQLLENLAHYGEVRAPGL